MLRNFIAATTLRKRGSKGGRKRKKGEKGKVERKEKERENLSCVVLPFSLIL